MHDEHNEHFIDLSLRIRQTRQGWIVEKRKRTWYGRARWIHAISYAGLPDRPFYFSTAARAAQEAGWYLEISLIREVH